MVAKKILVIILLVVGFLSFAYFTRADDAVQYSPSIAVTSPSCSDKVKTYNCNTNDYKDACSECGYVGPDTDREVDKCEPGCIDLGVEVETTSQSYVHCEGDHTATCTIKGNPYLGIGGVVVEGCDPVQVACPAECGEVTASWSYVYRTFRRKCVAPIPIAPNPFPAHLIDNREGR